MYRNHPQLRAVAILVTLVFAATLASAQGDSPRALDPQGIQKLVDQTGGEARVSLDRHTGAARFVRLPSGNLQLAVPPKASTRARAEAFFREYGSIFGMTEVASELRAQRTWRDGLGGEHEVFQQSYRGVPVFGAELRAHFHRGRLTVVNGTFLPGLKLDTVPVLSLGAAQEIALHTVAGQQDESIYKQRGDLREEEYLQSKAAAFGLTAASNTLYVFRAGLLMGAPGRDHLVYEVEVVNPKRTLREFVYVDAHTGAVVDQITGIHEALDREIYEGSLANLVWDESNGDPNPIPMGWAGGTPQQIIDWQDELDGAGETYYFFASMTAGAYLSYDGVDATMLTVNNDPTINCPNANWNGTSTNYCTGVTGDDTVAHEWGHAYTEYTNNLIYQWQSGALNESYSDFWGEGVDFLNGRGTDAPNTLRSTGGCSIHGSGAPSVDNSYRWLSGEDDPAFNGAIRDLWNPNCYGDPGKVTDSQYWCTSGDSGGVHTNSGIPNHAFALMVDGGTFNSYTITGLGLTKASHIHWGAQNLLTPASNFADHADALDSACTTLTGVNLPALSTTVPNASPSGIIITAADCAEVAKINDAVELRTPVSQCNFSTLLDPNAPPLCSGVGSVQTASFEDFESGSLPAGWSVSSHDVANPATFDNPGWSVASSLPAGASGSFATFVPDLNQGNCAADDESGALALDSPAIVLPAGAPPHVAFDHWVATETTWDGGNLKVSVNGGPWTLVPSGAYDFNTYNDELSDPPGNTNPLASEEAFTGTDAGSNGGSWGQSQVALYGLAFPGDTVRLRFDFGVDGCAGVIGWYVDDVRIYTCSDEPLPICGDGQLDLGEACDDGNMSDGDGCSSTCQVEDGWICEDPMPSGTGTNVVDDGSFEAGPFGGTWSESSTNFGTPICDVGSCGTGTGTGPSDGSFWVWFGGIGTYEAGSVSQSVTIPATATDLTFDLEQIVCDSGADYMQLLIDGNQELLSTGSSGLCGALGYSAQSIDVTAYADGGTHTLTFSSEIFANNGGGTNFFVDDVVLSDNVPSGSTPSVCTPIVEEVACNAGIVGFDDGIPGAWTVTDNTGLGLVWSNISGAGEIGNYTGGDGDAATVSSDVHGPADFDTELITNVFSLADVVSASLDYLVNYQNYAFFDFLDVDVSTDGGATWTNLLSWNEDHGGFRGIPGEAVSIDLAPYLGASNVQLRWRYYDPTNWDWDWYAQVDNVTLTCNRAPDCASATASPDTLWSPEHQFVAIKIDITDPDGDGVTVTVDSIFQDEQVHTPGTGSTSPDGQGVGTSTAEVRAERDGGGNGRVYHISFTADDGRGATCSGEVLVGVPHDQGDGGAVDDGALYDSTQP